MNTILTNQSTFLASAIKVKSIVKAFILNELFFGITDMLLIKQVLWTAFTGIFFLVSPIIGAVFTLVLAGVFSNVRGKKAAFTYLKYVSVMLITPLVILFFFGLLSAFA